MNTYCRPATLDQALGALAEGDWCVLAGGTDVYACEVPGNGKPLLDVSRLPDLTGIDIDHETIRIGAVTSWSTLRKATLPPFMRAVQQVAGLIGGRQVQNKGTIGGNICNASSAADGIPALLALGAGLELQSSAGRRHVDLASFLAPDGPVQRRSDELLMSIVLPIPAGPSSSAFVKLGRRSDLTIAVVMMAALVEWAADGSVGRAAISVGAASRRAVRLHGLEDRLRGWRPISTPAVEITPEDIEPLSPIDDSRASANYRRCAATILLGQLVRDVTRHRPEALAHG